jgi:hypothetical protein
VNRAELFANYDNFDREIIEVSREEFYNNLEKEFYSNREIDSRTEVQSYPIDGYVYKFYSTLYNVGWQGDMDSDCFICKIKTLTKAEVEHYSNIFSRPNNYDDAVDYAQPEIDGY